MHDVYMFMHVEYLSKSERRESESNYDSMGSRDLIGDSFTPPDSGMNDDDDDQGECRENFVIVHYMKSCNSMHLMLSTN
jgi:hypothetical protein